jgi:hypothetical protein
MVKPLRSETLTLLFSDIEGSTRLLTQLGVHYGEALSVQRSIMREEITRRHGTEIGTGGDSFFVVFTSATDAVGAALAAQRRLASYDWPDGAKVCERQNREDPGRSQPQCPHVVEREEDRMGESGGAAEACRHSGQQEPESRPLPRPER